MKHTHTSTTANNDILLRVPSLTDMADMMRAAEERMNDKTIAHSARMTSAFSRLLEQHTDKPSLNLMPAGAMTSLSGIPFYIDDTLPADIACRILNKDREIIFELKK